MIPGAFLLIKATLQWERYSEAQGLLPSWESGVKAGMLPTTGISHSCVLSTLSNGFLWSRRGVCSVIHARVPVVCQHLISSIKCPRFSKCFSKVTQTDRKGLLLIERSEDTLWYAVLITCHQARWPQSDSLFCVHASTCEHMYHMCVYMHFCEVCVHVCVPESQKFLNSSPSYFQRLNLSVNLELTELARVLGLRTSGSSCLPFPMLGLQMRTILLGLLDAEIQT